MQKVKTVDLILCGLFAALSGILSQLMIPIGAVPITMTHIPVFLAAGLLGAKYGTVSQIIFVLLGAAGVPVFAGFSGGIGRITGPTGGFIVGYILCVFVAGIITDRWGKSIKILLLAMTCGMITSYFSGLLWYMYITKADFITGFFICVLPFLLGDSMKIVFSSFLANRLFPILCSKKS